MGKRTKQKLSPRIVGELVQDGLPTEDEETLRAAVVAFNTTGQLVDFLHRAGDLTAAEIQRKRYAVKREITV